MTKMGCLELLLLVVTCIICARITQAEFALPTENEVYMDTLQKEIEWDVKEAQEELVTEAKSVRTATETYAKAKLAQNIFRALRVLVVKELAQVPLPQRLRQPRQEDGDETPAAGPGDDEDASESNAGSSSGDSDSSTTARTVPLIPVLAGILKSVFGGGENATTNPLNVTHSIQHATKLLFPLGLPFQGVSNFLGRRRATPAPTTVIKYYPVPVYPTTEPPTEKTTTRILRLVGRQGRVPRQLANVNHENHTVPARHPLYANLNYSAYAPSFSPAPNQNTEKQIKPANPLLPPMLIYAPNHVLGGAYAPQHLGSAASSLAPNIEIVTASVTQQTTRAVTKAKPQEVFIPAFAEAVAEKPQKASANAEPVQVTQAPLPIPSTVPVLAAVSESVNETSTLGSTEPPQPGLIYVDSLARDVQNGFDGFVKNLPDILKGAKEAIALLGNLREIFGEEEDA